MQKLYFGGSIITMENHIQPQAVLTSDGFITGVGDFSALDISAPNAEKIDLKGATMLPSFMDAHSHFSSYATSFLQASLEECVSFEEIGNRVQKFIADNKIPKGEWVNARGYDHNMLIEKRHPDLTFLDACAPDNPLILQHASGHVGVFNSMALKSLGITCDTPSPAGGKIGHEGGKLNGYMEENAFITYLKKVPMADIKDMVSAFEKAQNGYASRGITTIQEGMTVAQLIPLYQMLLGMDALKLDVVAYADMKDAKTLFSTFPNSVQKYDKHLKLGGYKIFLDGSPQGRTAWLRQPYEGEKEYCGYGTMEDEQVKKAI
ncbi:MAG: amidohydrolase family protein, partial [Oscillospiraceae bacterium]